jgi:hypothetical protein
MPPLTRRQVFTGMAKVLGGAALALVRDWFGIPSVQAQSPSSSRIFLPVVSGGANKKLNLFVARNGTPTANVQKVVELAGRHRPFCRP